MHTFIALSQQTVMQIKLKFISTLNRENVNGSDFLDTLYILRRAFQKMLEHNVTQEKTPLINYVIGNKKKEKNLREPRFTRIL